MGTNKFFPQEVLLVLRKGVGLPQVASSRCSKNGQAFAQVGCSTDFGNEQVFTQVVGSRCFEKGHVLPQMEYPRRFQTQQYFYPRRLFMVLWKQAVVPRSSFPQVFRKRASFSYMACSRCFKDGQFCLNRVFQAPLEVTATKSLQIGAAFCQTLH